MSDSDIWNLTQEAEPTATSSPVPPSSPVYDDHTSVYMHSTCYITNMPNCMRLDSSCPNQAQCPLSQQFTFPSQCQSHGRQPWMCQEGPSNLARVARPQRVNRSTSAPLSFLNTIHPVSNYNRTMTQPLEVAKLDEGRPQSVTAWAETPQTPTIVMDLHVPARGIFTREKVSSIGRTPSFLQNIRTLLINGLSPFSSSGKENDLKPAPCSSARYTLRRSSSCGDDLSSTVNLNKRLIGEERSMSNASFLSRTLSEPALVNLYFDAIVPTSALCKLPRQNTELTSYSAKSALASRSTSVDERLCRICWAGDDGEPCIQPCYCSTSVHESCMQKWLQISNSSQCEVCQYRFNSKVMLKPFSQWRWWLSKNRNMAQLEATILLLGIVTPPLLCGIILCSQKIAEYLQDPHNAWKTAGLMTLVLISMVTYMAAMIYFFIKFGTVCKLWLDVNRTTVIHIVPLTDTQRRPWLHAVTMDRSEHGTNMTGDVANHDNGRVWSIA